MALIDYSSIIIISACSVINKTLLLAAGNFLAVCNVHVHYSYDLAITNLISMECRCIIHVYNANIIIYVIADSIYIIDKLFFVVFFFFNYKLLL